MIRRRKGRAAGRVDVGPLPDGIARTRDRARARTAMETAP